MRVVVARSHAGLAACLLLPGLLSRLVHTMRGGEEGVTCPAGTHSSAVPPADRWPLSSLSPLWPQRDGIEEQALHTNGLGAASRDPPFALTLVTIWRVLGKVRGRGFVRERMRSARLSALIWVDAVLSPLLLLL